MSLQASSQRLIGRRNTFISLAIVDAAYLWVAQVGSVSSRSRPGHNQFTGQPQHLDSQSPARACNLITRGPHMNVFTVALAGFVVAVDRCGVLLRVPLFGEAWWDLSGQGLSCFDCWCRRGGRARQRRVIGHLLGGTCLS